MRGISIVVGLVVGAGSLIWLGNRGPLVLADGDHPLPSATARYERPRASGASRASRYLPSVFGGGDRSSIDPATGDYTGEDWIEVPVLAVDMDGRPLAGASIETRTTTAALASGRLATAEVDARIAAEEALDSALPPPLPSLAMVDPAESYSHARISVARARTGPDGRARVRVPPLVQVTLLARGADGEEGVSAPVYALALSRDADTVAPEEVVIEAAPLAVLSGEVRDERGRAIAGATLTISPRDIEYGAEVPELVALAGASEEGTVYTDANGAFRIPLRRSGAYDLTVEAQGFQLHSEPAAQAVAGHDSKLQVTLLEAAAVRGRILDASGAPVEGAYADLRGLDGGAAGAYVAVSTMPDGTFVAEGLAPGNYELRATATGFRGARLDLATGARSIDVRLDRGTVLAGTVVADLRALGYDPGQMFALEDGGAQAVVAVMVQSAGAPIAFFAGADPARAPAHETLTVEPRSWGVATLDRDGRGTFEIPGLPPGDVLVFLQAGELRTRTTHARLMDGTTSTLHLRADAGTIDVPEPPQIAMMETIELPVDPDTYLGTGTEEEVAEEEIAAEEPSPYVPDLRIESGPTGPFVVRAGMPSSGPRLVGGDRVVAVDGTRLMLAGAELDPTYAAQLLLQGAENSSCVLTVERPATGETLTVSLPRSLPWSPPQHGCRLGSINSGEW